MHIFFSVGEPSGDQHAAHLITELKSRRPELEFSAFGGPHMQDAGCRLEVRLTDYAVMGFLKVFPLLWQFYKLVKQAERYFRDVRPDMVVLVDFPGFNWWIARKAKAAGIPVVYYLPPQLWAWAPWRIRRVRKYVDHVLCALPFEYDWYAVRGVQAEYVGHPFFDEAAARRLDPSVRGDWAEQPVRLVGALPGSRRGEVERNWPMMLDVMRDLHAQHPDVRFLVPCYKPEFESRCRELATQGNIELPITYYEGMAPEVIDAAECCLMVSGSVSLEMLARRTPAAVIYRSNIVAWTLLGPIIQTKFITLVNLIAGREVFPEWVIVARPKRDRRAIVATLDEWLSNDDALSEQVGELEALASLSAEPGGIERAAEAVIRKLPAEEKREPAQAA